MRLESLLGHTFDDKELFELLTFEIESNFQAFIGICVNLYFNRDSEGEITVREVVHLPNRQEQYRLARLDIEKREWIEVGMRQNHYSLRLCRLDRTGYIAVIWPDQTISHESKLEWIDEFDGSNQPLTQKEIRLGFLELMGLMKSEALEDPRSKKSA